MTRLLTLLLHDVYEDSPSESGFCGPAADRYKLRRADFDAQLAGLRARRADAPVLLPAAVPPGAGGDAPFALTVDDGGVSYYTIVADRLERLGWRAHCFVTTDYIGHRGFLDAGQLRELHARGHVIGTHSASHPQRLSACPWPRLVAEWADSRRALADLLGADVVVGSIPGGYASASVVRAAWEAGLQWLFTSEPDVRVGRGGAGTLLGRFTIRRDSRPDFAQRLAANDPIVRWREWGLWNAKKLAKAVLRDAYPRLARRGSAAPRSIQEGVR